MTIGTKAATAALGVAIVAVAGAGVADASSAKPVLLGHSNKATATTTIKTKHGTPLSLAGPKSAAPLKVSSTKEVKKLNAQYLDGETATQVGPKSKQLVGQFTTGGAYILCPSGMHPISGGVLPDPTGANDTPFVAVTFPHINATTDAFDGWEGAAGDADGTYTGGGFIWVNCSGASTSGLSAGAVAKAERIQMAQTLARFRANQTR